MNLSMLIAMGFSVSLFMLLLIFLSWGLYTWAWLKGFDKGKECEREERRKAREVQFLKNKERINSGGYHRELEIELCKELFSDSPKIEIVNKRVTKLIEYREAIQKDCAIRHCLFCSHEDRLICAEGFECGLYKLIIGSITFEEFLK
jgi:hypothetical protein